VHEASRGPFLRVAKIFWIAPAVFENSPHLAQYLTSCVDLAGYADFFLFGFQILGGANGGSAAAVFRNLRRDLAFRQGQFN
jgi:hypothetical protein